MTPDPRTEGIRARLAAATSGSWDLNKNAHWGIWNVVAPGSHGEAAMRSCRGCGAAMPGDVPIPDRCDQCPPETCSDCGGVNDHATNRMCACWTPLKDMPLADIKALFARGAPELSLNPRIQP